MTQVRLLRIAALGALIKLEEVEEQLKKMPWNSVTQKHYEKRKAEYEEIRHMLVVEERKAIEG